jgi:hypothetical protein
VGNTGMHSTTMLIETVLVKTVLAKTVLVKTMLEKTRDDSGFQRVPTTGRMFIRTLLPDPFNYNVLEHFYKQDTRN